VKILTIKSNTPIDNPMLQFPVIIKDIKKVIQEEYILYDIALNKCLFLDNNGLVV